MSDAERIARLRDLNESLLDYFNVATSRDTIPPEIEVTSRGYETEEIFTGHIGLDLFELLKEIRATLDDLEEED